uniref:Uncharacterized protein n=1 Tax=Heterorhabditis bacteriophora TaxID=37862 RepID=A0A1I7XNL7_HETBA
MSCNFPTEELTCRFLRINRDGAPTNHSIIANGGYYEACAVGSEINRCPETLGHVILRQDVIR